MGFGMAAETTGRRAIFLPQMARRCGLKVGGIVQDLLAIKRG